MNGAIDFFAAYRSSNAMRGKTTFRRIPSEDDAQKVSGKDQFRTPAELRRTADATRSSLFGSGFPVAQESLCCFCRSRVRNMTNASSQMEITTVIEKSISSLPWSSFRT
jgi:hypothetical protein